MKLVKQLLHNHSLKFGTAALALLITSFSIEATPVTAEDAHAIGVEAYLYFYPLVTMDVPRKQLTNVDRSEGLSAPMNSFANIPAYPTADMKAVVRPNFDTLYSSAWLDLTREPVVVSVPDTGGRYYLFPMLDMWTDVFASPGWTGSVPDGMQEISAPTPYI